MHVCVCVCACVREREREILCVCVCVCVSVYEKDGTCVGLHGVYRGTLNLQIRPTVYYCSCMISAIALFQILKVVLN